MRRPLAVVGIVFSVARVTRADAGVALPFELTWEAPATCPDASFVRHRVEQIVRAPPSEHTVVVAKAMVGRTEEHRFRLDLTLRTGDLEETKTIEAASCSSLAQATATIIALAIESPTGADSEARTAPPASGGELAPPPAPAAPEPAREADAPPAPPQQRGVVERPPPVPSRAWSLAPGAFTAIDTATLPEVAASFGLSAALRLQRFRVGLLGDVALRQSSKFSRTAGVAFDKLGGGAWGAYLVPLGRDISIGPSANVEATFVRAEAFGVRSPRNSWTVWPTVATGGRLEARISRWFWVVARGELLFNIDAPPFSLATVEEPLQLHEPGSPSVRMSLGLEIVLP